MFRIWDMLGLGRSVQGMDKITAVFNLLQALVSAANHLKDKLAILQAAPVPVPAPAAPVPVSYPSPVAGASAADLSGAAAEANLAQSLTAY